MTKEVEDIYREHIEEMQEFFEYNETKLTDRCKKEFREYEKVINRI